MLTMQPLKALEPERVTARQIEAARRAMTRHMKRQGRVWIRIFPDVPVSKKPTAPTRSDEIACEMSVCCTDGLVNGSALFLGRVSSLSLEGRRNDCCGTTR